MHAMIHNRLYALRSAERSTREAINMPELYPYYGPPFIDEESLTTDYLPGFGCARVRGNAHPLRLNVNGQPEYVCWDCRHEENRKRYRAGSRTTELDPETCIEADQQRADGDAGMWNQLTESMGLTDPNGPIWTGDLTVCQEMVEAMKDLEHLLNCWASAGAVHR